MAKANSGGSHHPKHNSHSRKHGAVAGGDRLLWRRIGSDLALVRGKSKTPLLRVVPDPTWPGMFRVRLTSGFLTDFCNLTRAKDAAIAIALRDLNCEVQEKPLDGTYVRARRRGVGVPPPDPTRVPAASKKLTFGDHQ
jgi:hypothetical protein